MKINVNNKESIGLAIEEAEGRATARCITWGDIDREIDAIEERLRDLHIRERKWSGMSFKMTGGSLGASKGYGESTHAILERGERDWFLVSVGREQSPDANGMGDQSYVYIPGFPCFVYV